MFLKKNKSYPARISVKVKVKSLSPTLCDPMDCSPPGSSIHGTLQARALEWGSIAFSKPYITAF